MKTRAGVLAALALLMLGATAALAQSSDYEIIETFRKTQKSLLESIRAAADPGRCIALGGEIDRLEADHEGHRKLLSEGLYPETLESSIAALREQLGKATERVALAEQNRRALARIEVISKKADEDAQRIELISRQNEEYRESIDKLTQEVNGLSARIQRLSEENAGLIENLKALRRENKKDKESIARLKELTEKLNANLRDRDELILAMMDALFNEYSKTGLTDVRRQDLFASSQSNDYVGKIVATVDGNIGYVESASLTPQDVKLLGDEQRRLAARWEEIKPLVAKIYPDEQSRARDISAVDGRVADWGGSLSRAVWRGVHQAFVEQSIDIGAFQDAGEFHSRLSAYIDRQIEKPARGTFRAFKHRVWDSPVKDQWLPLIPTAELSAQQRSDLDQRVAQWDRKITSGTRRWVLLGVLVAVLVALFAVIGLRKKKPAPAA